MRGGYLKGIGALAAGLLLAGALTVPGSAGGEGSRVVSALGVARAGGQEVVVDVLVVVPPGANERAAIRDALAGQGARPFEEAHLGSTGFTLTGLVWDALPVVQNYNPADEPLESAQTALTNTHGTWDGVATSLFDIDFGGITDRCPSLVRECPGPQTFDGFNDVGWVKLDRFTLGVTWFGTSTDEADIALNTRFTWNGGCTDVANSFDMETVYLHENGHVVGLGHSDVPQAVMYTPYQEARCDLHTDDAEGATYLYPTQRATVSGTVTDSSGGISGATVTLADTGLSTTTDGSGNYEVTGVPYPVTYDITASHPDYDNETVRLTVDTDPEDVDFTLTASGGGGGGDDDGGPPWCTPESTHPACS